jgi:hypothetical protein
MFDWRGRFWENDVPGRQAFTRVCRSWPQKEQVTSGLVVIPGARRDTMTPDIQDFTPLAIQSAVFVHGLVFSDPLALAQAVQRAVGGVFDGQPAVLPVPPNAPGNVPRILLKDRLERYQCKVSAGRFDLAFDGSKRRETPIGIVWDEYSGIIRQLAEYLKKKNPTRVWRLGLVVRLFKVLPRSASIHIRETYFKDDRFQNAYEIHVSVLDKECMGTFNINRWLRVRPLRKRDDPEDDRGLGVDVDINTLAEEKNDFTEEEITEFFEEAFQHVVLRDIRLLNSE